MSNSTSSSSKSHSKRSSNSNRERDKNKSVASESGGSSQCDTPPLIEKDGSTAQGKYAGIGPESINCMADQIGADISIDAATNLAEDVSYKLRQVISNIVIQSSMSKKTQVDSVDVNSTLMLSDTSPVVGTNTNSYVVFGDEKLCTQQESVLNVTEYALTSQSFVYTNTPTLSVEWITDEKSLSSSSNISVQLQNYYTKVARAILNLKQKLKDVAVEDLKTNTRIGPIFPNLFNLAVLVLNDDNLKALNVPAKKPLQSNVLDMVDALCSNPCSLDTNIQQQFQRLFPVMVSNILGNGSLSDKMVAILTKITRTWPAFVTMGKEILFEYLSQESKERLTPPMIACVTALGRRALVECLAEHLDHIDQCMQMPRRTYAHIGLRETILEASTKLLRAEGTTWLEDYVATDYTLYEMLADSVLPRRTLFPYTEPTPNDASTKSKNSKGEFPYMHSSVNTRVCKIRTLLQARTTAPLQRELVFHPTQCRTKQCINIKVKSFRSAPKLTQSTLPPYHTPARGSARVVVASGLLNRFRYKMNKRYEFPIFGAYVL